MSDERDETTQPVDGDLEPDGELAETVRGGRSANQPTVSEIVITKTVDKPSPKL